MTGESQSALTAFLYTDVVNSTELLSRLGDERAQRVFQAHHKVLREATVANGGQEVKWQGDGVMVAFASTAAAVRCAISMQQATHRPIDGERLEVRIGLNVGEALGWEEADYFGSPVVVAARLCHEAKGGQILCGSVIAALLSGRQAFQFRDVGEVQLKGIPEPVDVREVIYEQTPPGALLRHTPFVGRTDEIAKLGMMLAEAKAGRGGLAMLVGEPGIGKTRMAEEFAESARKEGVTVLWGRCYEGEWAPPYGPFAEAIQQYARTADADDMRDDLGNGAGPLARIAPELHERLPDTPEPVALDPDEERFRLLDSVSQFLIAASRRAPLLLVLDDLHWADRGSIAMLRHVSRFVSGSRTLILGAYRDVELDRQHPLADALGDLQREANYERVLLKGLATSQVGELLANIGEQDLPDDLVSAISAETDGNPFFVRAVLLDLVEKGAIYWRDGRWTTDAKSIKDMRIPEGVRQVVGRRLSRLSDDTNALLTAASAFSAGYRFDIAAAVANLDEPTALDAIDEALEAQIINPGADAVTFDFVHASIRHTLYTELSPPRQVRLHRQVAEAMEKVYGEKSGDHAAELAYQYHRSSTLPGSEAGVEYAMIAAGRAEAAYAHGEAATFLRMSVELLADGDERRARILGRLGVALGFLLDDDAVPVMSEAADLIAEVEGKDAAAYYLAGALLVSAGGGIPPQSLVLQGLRYAGDRRDAAWVRLMSAELVAREAQDPNNPGIPLDSPERLEISGIIKNLPPELRASLGGVVGYYRSRDEILAETVPNPLALLNQVGEFRLAAQQGRDLAAQAEQQGRLVNAAAHWASVARCQNALGDFTAAREAYRRARELGARLGPGFTALALAVARFERDLAHDERWEAANEEVQVLMRQPAVANQWVMATLRGCAAAISARLGREDDALRWLAMLVAPLEQAPGWVTTYPTVAGLAAHALWELQRTDHIDIIERNVREKVVAPGFGCAMFDGRLSLARLSALQDRYDEAVDWFTKARTALDEQGARPLRAIVDYDEALMYHRRGEPGDRARMAPLLEAALTQFRELGMTGWIRRGEELQQR